MNTPQAIEQVRNIIFQAWKNKPKNNPCVDIELWGASHPSVGIRVAEVSFCQGSPDKPPYGGAAVMQIEAECGNLLFATERAILLRVIDDNPDDIERADENLRFIVENNL